MAERADISLRTRLTASGIFIAWGESVTLTLNDVTVVIAHGAHPHDASKNVVLLEGRAQRVVPPAVADFLVGAMDGNETAAPDHVLGFCCAVSSELAVACMRAFELIRWRDRSDSPHSPYASLGSEWTADGETWRPLPSRVRVAARLMHGMRLVPQSEAAVQALAGAGAVEPVAHQLLREAIDVFHANPRSALVICIAAVESGFKHLVAELVPEAGWLVENSPSPPLVKMLSNYLPTLPARAHIDGSVPAPPKYVRTLLGKAVEERNKVAHKGIGTMTPDELQEMLDAAGDLLYLFDYYSGQEWALEKVSGKFRDGLTTS